MMTWTLYDKDLNFLGPIDRALSDGFERKMNELSTASLELSTHDPVNQQIDVPASFVHIEDGDEDLGYFRFAQIPRDEHAPRGRISYVLQSGECTLLDSMLDGWHEVGGTGISTRMVLEYILSHQNADAVQWVLGDCEFEEYYQYNFQDVTLLEAIMSLGEVLLHPYEFVFDTTVTPWTMHLRRAEEEAYCSLVYRRNMTAIRRSVTGGVVTRLYGRGYGEGDNQLTIASVNGGLPYLDAAPEVMARWGVREGVHVDTRQTDPALLKARMQAILAGAKEPTHSYEADAIDLYRATGKNWDRVREGKKVLVLDEVSGAPITVRVKSRKKTNASGKPGEVSYVLDNSVADTAQELNEILDKIGVHELYSQGATNMYSMQISDNADAEHPLEMRFYVPGNVLRINSCIVYWQLERFRSYVKALTAEASAEQTSKTGGGATVTIPEQTLSMGVRYTSSPVDTEGSSVSLTGGPKNYLGSVSTSTGSAGNHSHNFTHVHALSDHDHEFTGESETYSIGHNHSLAGEGAQATGAIYSGNKSIRVTPQGTVEGSGTLWTTSAYDVAGGSGKQATGENGSHSHSFDHVHNMPHVHDFAHEHTIPAMKFTLQGHSHTVTIPEHTHEFEYGVYEGDRAESVMLRVDGEEVPASEIDGKEELDVAKYLKKNDDGKVTRGTWHRIEFVPGGVTRITADLFFQVFIQSRGAGDY